MHIYNVKLKSKCWMCTISPHFHVLWQVKRLCTCACMLDVAIVDSLVHFRPLVCVVVKYNSQKSALPKMSRLQCHVRMTLAQLDLPPGSSRATTGMTAVCALPVVGTDFLLASLRLCTTPWVGRTCHGGSHFVNFCVCAVDSDKVGWLFASE
jgi:hypothetical protein